MRWRDWMSDAIQVSKKVVLLGDPAVGKTSMIRKFVHDIFDDKYISTLGTKVSSKQLIFEHPKGNGMVEVKLMIWDIVIIGIIFLSIFYYII